jgi:hypothetical protein
MKPKSALSMDVIGGIPDSAPHGTTRVRPEIQGITRLIAGKTIGP